MNSNPLSTREVATLLKVEPYRIRNLIDTGKISAQLIGGVYLFDYANIVEAARVLGQNSDPQIRAAISRLNPQPIAWRGAHSPMKTRSYLPHATDAHDKRARFLAVNLARRAGIPDLPEERDIDNGHVTPHGIARELLRMGGVPNVMDMTPNELWMASFNPTNNARMASVTSADLPNLLGNVQGKALINAYQIAKATWRSWCRIGNLTDFKPASRVQLSDFAQFRETGENGEIADSKLSDRKENIQLAYYGRMISISLIVFVNDDLRAITDPAAKLGKAAAQLISRLVYLHLLSNPTMSDGKALFHADHGNLLAGTTSALDATNAATALAAAASAFHKQTSPQAPNDTEFAPEPLDLEPRVLLVPPECNLAADRVANPNLYVSDNKFFANKYDIQTEARLSNAGYAGYSTKAWYAAADPAQADTVEVGFLNGDEEPTVESFQDQHTLAVKTRGYLAVGVKALDWRGIVKSTGEAEEE